MDKKLHPRFFSTLFLIMLILIAVGEVFLFAKAKLDQRRFQDSIQAAAISCRASDAFYAASSAQELAALLGGKARGSVIKAEYDQGMSLAVSVSEEDSYIKASIAVYSGKEKMISFECLKPPTAEDVQDDS